MVTSLIMLGSSQTQMESQHHSPLMRPGPGVRGAVTPCLLWLARPKTTLKYFDFIFHIYTETTLE